MLTLIYLLNLNFYFVFNSFIMNPFPEIEGLVKNGEIEIYNSDNLFDYINGAADAYLNYDFVSLTLQRYKGKNDQSLKIEIYEHSNILTGFGIYSSERPSEGNWVKVGEQGYLEKGILNFYKDRFYVKIMTYAIENSKDVLINTALLISENLDIDNEVVTTFELFPNDGKKDNSDKYIHKNFLGYEALSGAFTAEYEVDDNYFELFLIKKKNKIACKEMLENYFRSVKLDSTKIIEGKILINDPYQGDFNVIWNKNILIGAINYSDAKLAEQYLDLMLIKIKSHRQ